MSKTLADMNPEQCAQCIGMWCDFLPGDKDHGEPEQGILAYWSWVREEAVITFPALADTRKWAHPESVTPRYDLPRAWNPEGAPVEMDIETSIVRDHPRGGMVGTFESPWYVDQPPGTTMRRFVGEWEEA